MTHVSTSFRLSPGFYAAPFPARRPAGFAPVVRVGHPVQHGELRHYPPGPSTNPQPSASADVCRLVFPTSSSRGAQPSIAGIQTRQLNGTLDTTRRRTLSSRNCSKDTPRVSRRRSPIPASAERQGQAGVQTEVIDSKRSSSSKAGPPPGRRPESRETPALPRQAPPAVRPSVIGPWYRSASMDDIRRDMREWRGQVDFHAASHDIDLIRKRRNLFSVAAANSQSSPESARKEKWAALRSVFLEVGASDGIEFVPRLGKGACAPQSLRRSHSLPPDAFRGSVLTGDGEQSARNSEFGQSPENPATLSKSHSSVDIDMLPRKGRGPSARTARSPSNELPQPTSPTTLQPALVEMLASQGSPTFSPRKSCGSPRIGMVRSPSFSRKLATRPRMSAHAVRDLVAAPPVVRSSYARTMHSPASTASLATNASLSTAASLSQATMSRASKASTGRKSLPGNILKELRIGLRTRFDSMDLDFCGTPDSQAFKTGLEYDDRASQGATTAGPPSVSSRSSYSPSSMTD